MSFISDAFLWSLEYHGNVPMMVVLHKISKKPQRALWILSGARSGNSDFVECLAILHQIHVLFRANDERDEWDSNGQTGPALRTLRRCDLLSGLRTNRDFSRVECSREQVFDHAAVGGVQEFDTGGFSIADGDP